MHIKKLTALFIIAALTLSVFSGCSKEPESIDISPSPSDTAEQASEESSSLETTAPSESSDPITEPEAPSGEITPTEGDDAPKEKTPVNLISYPISDGTTTFTFWKPWDSGFSGFFDSYNSLEALSIVEEDTGVKLNIIEVGENVATEQFNLMAAAESWTDFVDVSRYYNGGVTSAYTDDVIYDLTDYLEQYMPDYYSQFTELNEATQKSLTADDGRIYTLATLSNAAQQVQGLAIRKDWLDDLGLDIPKTISEFSDVMRAFYTQYDSSHTIYADKTGVISHVYGAFDSNAFGVSASMFGGSSLAYYQQDGTAYTALQSDGYRQYLEWFIEMYNEGLIYKDFYTETLSSAEDEAIQTQGQTGAFHVRAEKFSVLTEYAEDEDYELIGIAPIVMNANDTYKFGDLLRQTGRNSVNISTTCEDLEMALMFLNYFFTDTGYITFNFGIENESYAIDENGEPQYTELITEDTNANQIVAKYTFSILIGKENAAALYGAYWQSELDAMELWTETMQSDYTMPSVSLTTEESAEHANLSGDIITFAQESILRFITGETELNDATWAEFQAQLVILKINDCVALYQNALDRYMQK